QIRTPKIIVLTTFDDDEYALHALRGGASGFLLKDTLPEVLLDSIRTVVDGGAVIAPTTTRRLLDNELPPRLGAGGPHDWGGGRPPARPACRRLRVPPQGHPARAAARLDPHRRRRGSRHRPHDDQTPARQRTAAPPRRRWTNRRCRGRA